MTRRGIIEQEIDVLEEIYKNQPIKLTHLIYKTNINYILLKDILKILRAKGFINVVSKTPTRNLFELTPLGEKSLNELKRLIVML